MPGQRPVAYWEYDFRAVYEGQKHLDTDGLVRLDEDGTPSPYQRENEPDILKLFGLLTAKEELALRRQYPEGNEWQCPRFLLKTKSSRKQPGAVVEFTCLVKVLDTFPMRLLDRHAIHRIQPVSRCNSLSNLASPRRALPGRIGLPHAANKMSQFR